MSRRILLVLSVSLAFGACGPRGSVDRARTTAPSPSELAARRAAATDRVVAHRDGWLDGRRRALADRVLDAQEHGPEQFRSTTWGHLTLVTLVALLAGFLARVFMSLKMPTWWPWRRADRGATRSAAGVTTRGARDDERPLLVLLLLRLREGAGGWLSRVGNLVVGPAPRDHVWRREIHQSRDAERDLCAAARAAADLTGEGASGEATGATADLTGEGDRGEAAADGPAEGGRGDPTEAAIDEPPEGDRGDAPSAAADGASELEASGDRTETSGDDPIEAHLTEPAASIDDGASSSASALVAALKSWRLEVATARRCLENLEPLEHRRELLHALDSTQASAADLRVALTRAALMQRPADPIHIDDWRRIVEARPSLDQLTPKARAPEADTAWGHATAVLSLVACAAGIFCLAAWSAAGALPLWLGLALSLGGATSYAVARVQLDRSGRPRLLPGVADRLATRVATAALVIALAAWSSLLFGDELDLGAPPRLDVPAELLESTKPADLQQP